MGCGEGNLEKTLVERVKEQVVDRAWCVVADTCMVVTSIPLAEHYYSQGRYIMGTVTAIGTLLFGVKSIKDYSNLRKSKAELKGLENQ